MGRVYLGRTPAGSAVAVKVVHREYAGDASFRKRFEQEVAAARRVQGLYTVPVVDADLRADEPWLATAYVPGPSLQHAVDESGPLPADAALGLIARVAEALQSIHAADVIHRDLKPSNILLTPEGPKVIDFGIARASDLATVTATGMATGTPAYMAPEYIRGQDVTEAGDVFALGVIANFAATGRPAFGGGTDHSVIYRILEQDPALDGCPEPVRAIAARCLAKDPGQRPTPAEVIAQCRGVSTPEATGGEAHAVTVTDVPAPEPRPGPVTPNAPDLPDANRSDADTLTAWPPRGSAPGTPRPPTAVVGNVAASGPGPVLRPGSDTVPPGPDPEAAPTSSLPTVIGALGVAAVVVAVVVGALYLSPPSTHHAKPPYPTYAANASLSPVGQSTEEGQGMAFSPDGKLIATGGQDSKVRLWDVASHKTIASFTQRDSLAADGNPISVDSLAFSPDGKLLAAGSDFDETGVWDVAKRQEVDVLQEQGDSVAFSPDGTLFAAADVSGVVNLWHTSHLADQPTYVDQKHKDPPGALQPGQPVARHCG